MRAKARLIAGGAALVLAACGAAGPDGPADGSAISSGYVIDPATGEQRMTIEREDGPVTLRAGSGVPLSLPPGFSLFPGARVESNAVVTHPGGQGVMVRFAADASAEAVIAHHRREAEAAGFRIDSVLDTGEAFTITATRAHDRATLALDVAGSGPATGQLTILVGAGGGG